MELIERKADEIMLDTTAELKNIGLYEAQMFGKDVIEAKIVN